MKILLLLLLLAPCLRAAGQASPLPVDSTTRKVTYQGIVQVPGVSQAELYSRAREWFATSFGSAKAVLEMDDRVVSKMVGRYYATFGFSAGLSATPWHLWRTVTVEVKDGRYRYSFTRFGLGSSLWSENIQHAEALSKEIHAGCTFINGMVKSDPRLPFGGIKASGFGRELSYYGLREFLNAKTIWVK